MSPRKPSAAVDPAPLFAALGDPLRLRLVARLEPGVPLSITRLCEGAAVTRQAVTKHLRVLEQAGIVRSRREGRATVFLLEPRRLEVARQALEQISRGWDDALARLKARMED
jgi:DNA-binding transcriptional ArsR family regulator